ncbi:MAG: PaaI family thioesterase [Deltaproteobacteria bacterium]|nr:PaaI family thioesterase [Deltaproteobacteria bacterium]MBW2112451.1 PaaI family thioesterase [Deltaproteobacteria bacterium]MBW2354713.1 PaaI family thioesterase [Deltaproteobacteria bacterium]
MRQYEALSPGFKESIVDHMKNHNHFWALLGMEIVDMKKGWARIRLPYGEKLANGVGVAHGGAIFSPADSAVGMALAGMLNSDETISTLEMKINYLKPVSGGVITAEAWIIHRGSHTAIGDVEVSNEKGELVAKGLATFAIVRKK